MAMNGRVFGGVAGSLIVSVACLGTALVGTAAAAHLGCEETVTVSTTFDADVGPCGREGIIIGADNIVVDLAGYTLSGVSDPAADAPGIDTNGHSGVTIRNGTVTGFSAGVALNGGARNTVTNMLVQDNIGSPTGEGAYGDGIALFRSHNNRITRNRVIGNGTYDGIGVISGRDNVVEQNLVFQNDAAAEGSQSAIGIWVLSGAPGQDATGNVLRSNQVLRNGFHGIEISQFATGNVMQNNSVAQNGFGPGSPAGVGDGIAVRGNQNRVEGNNVAANGGDGISVTRSTVGPFLHGQSNTIRRNSSVRNNQGPDTNPEFDLTDTNTNPPCDANTWSANRFVTFNQPCVTSP